MLLSIIIPVYNCEKYLRKCVDSIFSQDLTKYELILVDDGSVDSSAEICDYLSTLDDRIIVVHKKNGGVSSARNVGLKIAKGELITFIDADDYLIEDTFLSSLVNCAEYDYVVTGFTYISYKNGCESERKKYNLESRSGNKINTFPDSFFINGGFHTVWGKLYKLEIIKDNNIIFNNRRISEDSLFNLEYLQYINKWKLLSGNGYAYLEYNQGKNATGKIEKNDIDVYVELHQKMIDLSIPKSVVKKTMYSQYLSLCNRCIRSNNITEADKKIIIRYILNKPRVRTTLLFTVQNIGEWLNGVLMCLKKK